MNNAEVLIKFIGDTKKLDKTTKSVGKTISNLGGNFAKIVGGSVVSTVSAAISAATTILAKFTKESINVYAELEQSLGGIETLFEDNADIVIKNAQKAYMTAGVSANTYMEQITSFSASLLQSVGGDTVKAAQIGDMAMQDMADNSNKFGTAIENIQNAYQGFAKQNYTMLDNLKLGYGGTRGEMERLLADAEKLSGIHYDISNLSDVYEAIHIIQEGLGVTGTTAKEASSTITGSMASAKAALENFVGGVGGIDEVITTFTTAGSNIVQAALKLLPNLVDGLVKLIEALIPEIPGVIEKLVPTFLEGMANIGAAILGQLPNLLDMLDRMLPQLVNTLVKVLSKMVKQVSKDLPKILKTVINVIMDTVISVLDNIDEIIDLVIELVNAIAEALVEALPVLLDKLPIIIDKVLDALIENYPKLIDAAWQIIGVIALGLIQALPQLITETLPKIIGSIIDFIVSKESMFFEKGKAIIGKIFEAIADGAKDAPEKVGEFIGTILGVIATLPEKIWNFVKEIPGKIWTALMNAKDKAKEVMPKIFNAIRDGIKELPDKMLNIGKDIVKGLWNGIKSMSDWVNDKVKSFANGVVNGLKKTLGIHSPSVVMEKQVGVNLGLGMVKGLEDTQDELDKSISTVANGINASLGLDTSTLGGMNAGNASPVVNVYADFSLDPIGQVVSNIKTFSGGAKNDFNYGAGV